MNKKTPKKACSFNDIKKYLEKPGNAGKEVLDAFEAITDAAIIFSPLFLGPQCISLLGVLDVKDRLFKICNLVYDCIVEKKQPDYITRVEQLRNAYALISVTAYLELLSDAIPKTIIKKLKNEIPNLNVLDDEAVEDSEASQPTIIITDYYSDHIITFAEVKEHIKENYEEASERIVRLIETLSDTFNDKQIKDYYEAKRQIAKLPKKALEKFEKQYLGLAIKFEDFAVFTQIERFDRLDNTAYKIKSILEELGKSCEGIDVGLKHLSEIANSFPPCLTDIQVKKIICDLKNVYADSINKPIIDQYEIEPAKDDKSIVFPRIVDSFIPQSYKWLVYNNEIRVEDKELWETIPENNDLLEFVLRYLCSPDSVNYPMIVLGQPGSGKSLLTKVLSAQLMSEAYAVIRIQLREVDAEASIDKLVDLQINKEINRPLPTGGYGEFADHFKDHPLLIILDGYDELLQAKGNVYVNYLESVRSFQEQQKVLNRPVRIIVTSRITLIDKAQIPRNSTIIRLLEFSSEQQKKWISIWNNKNAEYFNVNNLKPFKLPAKYKDKSNKILELAEQPLLLLMLALYDSDSNELSKSDNLKRTDLYDNLIRKFIRRERRRYVSRFDIEPEKQEQIIDEEMKRLGVVAIGMYNRSTVVIRSQQLEADLQTFNAQRRYSNADFKDSDSLLGSFFFVHESKAKDKELFNGNTISAYEFLHNTFGEFLAADFILRIITDSVVNVIRNREGDLDVESILKKYWFYCLMIVPLFSRPVVIEMLREHLDRAINNNLNVKTLSEGISRTEYCKYLKRIIENQLQLVICKTKLPEVMQKDNPFTGDMPHLGYLATYSLNLIILMCALDGGEYVFNEEEYLLYKKDKISEFGYAREDYSQQPQSYLNNQPWNMLTSLWKMWFSETDLLGMAAVIRAKRMNDVTVRIKCNNEFKAISYGKALDITLCVSNALGDASLVGLSGLHTQRFDVITDMNDIKDYIAFKDINPDIYILHIIKSITTLSTMLVSVKDIISHKSEVERVGLLVLKIIEEYEHGFDFNELDFNTIISLYDVLEKCLLNKLVHVKLRYQVVDLLCMLGGINKKLLYRVYSKPYYLSDSNILFDSGDNRFSKTNPLTINEYYDLFGITRNYSDYDRIIYNGLDIAFYNELLRVFSDSDNSSKIATLNKVLNYNFIDVLIGINPELLFLVLAELLDSSSKYDETTTRLIIAISKYGLKYINDDYIRHLKLDVINKIIIVSKAINADSIIKLFYNKLYAFFDSPDNNPRRIELFFSPGLVADLIEILPSRFRQLWLSKLSFFYDTQIYKYLGQRQYDRTELMDYIRVLLKLFSINHSDEKIHTEIKRCMLYIATLIKQRSDFSDMTIIQINDLQKCAEIIKDDTLIKKIKNIKRIV